MADPLGLVTIAIIVCACFIFIRYRRDFRLTRIAILITSSSLFIVSLTHHALSVSVAALIIASEIALLPIATYDFENHQRLQFKMLVTCQLYSHLFLIFAVLLKSDPNESILADALLVVAVSLRLILPFLSRSLNSVCLTVAPWSRSLFFLSSCVFAILVSSRFQSSLAFFMGVPFVVSLANTYWSENSRERFLFAAQTLVCVPFFLEPTLSNHAQNVGFSICLIMTIGLSQMILSSPRFSLKVRSPPRWFAMSYRLDIGFFLGLEYLCKKASFLCRRFLGPIIIERFLIQMPALVMSMMRFLLRIISYAGLPKLVATSIAVSILMLVYILKV